jgi:SAM-dependent methyltransferase
MYTKIEACRSCGSKKLTQVLDLGETPLADGLVRKDQLALTEPTYPLTCVVCGDCGLMQLRENVEADELFCQDYPYFSSFSDALLRHSKANVEELIEARGLGGDDLVIELASNDGYLLQYYAKNGIPVLGIDPAQGPADAAIEKGIPTINDFFTLALAEELRAEGKQANVIHGNNVLAHVPDLNGFVEGIATLLADDGVAVIECPHVLELIRHVEFDTIYHEHLCYFSVTALRPLFERHGLKLQDVRQLTIHGGSLRLFVGKEDKESENVRRLLAEEKAEGIDGPQGYLTFATRVEKVREDLMALLRRLKSEGATIAAYGAAAKGATLINYIGIGTDLVDFVVDRNTHKQGQHMPGQRLEILPVEALVEKQPDYTLLLAWNFKDEISEQQSEYREHGGRFIVPVPEPVIL